MEVPGLEMNEYVPSTLQNPLFSGYWNIPIFSTDWVINQKVISPLFGVSQQSQNASLRNLNMAYSG